MSSHSGDSSEPSLPSDSRKGQGPRSSADEVTDVWHAETDVEHAATLPAPSLPDAISRPRPPADRSSGFPIAGEQIDDFQLLQELGRGAMGVVYLARQNSLGREVALKVSRNVGDEARTMASLEHRHIVQVFSESVLREDNLRLLCMQLVPGVTLEAIIKNVRSVQGRKLDGEGLLRAVESANTAPALLDPQALRDREELVQCDVQEATCWLGVRLAEALAYAHRRGVLHRDIKPANILVDPYGNPRLADFSLSTRVVDCDDSSESLFGGTLNYMSPEHLRAFAQEIDPSEVGEAADVYSLGLVLFEMLTGEVPGVGKSAVGGRMAIVRRLLERRCEPPPSVRENAPHVSTALDRTLRRCLDPDPTRRFSSAEELAVALRGCLQLRQTERSLPPAGPLTRCCQQWPVACIIVLALAPHLAGSIVNISYNMWIIASLSDAQQIAFGRLVVLYNVVVYPLCLWAMVQQILLPAIRYRRLVQTGELSKLIEFDDARRQALSWPRWGAGVACLGWFPGAIFFPLGLHLLAGPLARDAAVQLVLSITLSGLIAITYSVVGLQLVALRVYYPALWDHAEALRETARQELAPVGHWLRLSQVLAGMIPLLGAVLLVAVGPGDVGGTPYRIYQLLVIALIGLGMGGLQLALTVADRLHKTIAALTGSA